MEALAPVPSMDLQLNADGNLDVINTLPPPAGHSPPDFDMGALATDSRYLQSVNRDWVWDGPLTTTWQAEAELDPGLSTHRYDQRQYAIQQSMPEPMFTQDMNRRRQLEDEVLDRMCREVANALPANQAIVGIDVSRNGTESVTTNIWANWATEVVTVKVRTVTGSNVWSTWSATNSATAATPTNFNSAANAGVSISLNATGSDTFSVTNANAAWDSWTRNYNAISTVVRGSQHQAAEERRVQGMSPEQRIEHEANLAREREQREADRVQRAAEGEARRAEAEIRYAAERADKSRAEDRAEELLHSMLNEQQLHMLTKEGKFLVEVNGGRVY